MDRKEEDIELLNTNTTNTNPSTDTNQQASSQPVESRPTTINQNTASEREIPSPPDINRYEARPNVVGASHPILPVTDAAMKTDNVSHKPIPNTPPLNTTPPVDDVSSKKEEDHNQKPIKPVVMIVLFIVILAAIFLLPYTGDLFDRLFNKDDGEPEEVEITTGTLTCTLENEEDSIEYHYTETYDFTDSKVETLQHVLLIQGNTDFLNQRYQACQVLDSISEASNSISVECNLESSEFVETQFFNLQEMDENSLSTAFIEAGGTYPNAEYQDDIDEVEKNLTISGYTCERS